MDKRRTGTKDRIMKVAVGLFSNKGFDGTSIRDIVRVVGISPASFYNHFESKEILLLEIWQYYRQQIIKPVELSVNLEEMIDNLGVVKFFETLIDIMFETEHEKELFKFSMLVAGEQHKNKAAAEIAYRSREKSRHMIREILALMARKGHLRTGIPQRMAEYFGYMLTGFSVDYYHYRYVQKLKPEDIVQRQKELVRQFCYDFLLPPS